MKKSILLLFILSPLISQTAWSNRITCDDRSIVVGFTGDILVHDALYKSILPQQSFVPLWEKVIPLFKKAHFMVGNLEGPAALGISKGGKDLGDQGFSYDLNVYSGTNFSFNFHPKILSDLKRSGFGLLSTANNHSLDRHWRGIDRTLEAAGQVGIATTGTRHSEQPDAPFYHIEKIQGFKVAFLACTEMSNVSDDRKKQVLFCFNSNRQVEQQIRYLKQSGKADAVIILPHWGAEYQQKPSALQRQWAQRFLDAGANAIVGSHPHVLQPLEVYQDQQGNKKVIAYSLGNFLAYQKNVSRKTGAVLYLKIGHSEKGEVEVKDVGYSPTFREGHAVQPVDRQSQNGGFDEAAKFLGKENYLAPTELMRGCR